MIAIIILAAILLPMAGATYVVAVWLSARLREASLRRLMAETEASNRRVLEQTTALLEEQRAVVARIPGARPSATITPLRPVS